jgi:uncharacterized protein (TIGR03067 family)
LKLALAKLKIATAVLMVALLAGTGIAFHAAGPTAAEPTAAPEKTGPDQRAPKQADPPKADVKAEDADKVKAQALTKLGGKWKVRTVELSGMQLPLQVFNVSDWEIADGKVKTGDEKGVRFTIDPAADPAHIDIEFVSLNIGAAKFEDFQGPVKGIYKLDGDKLTLCMLRDDDDRPSKFQSGNPAAGFKGAYILITFEREKKDK